MKRILLLFILLLGHQVVFSQLADCSGSIPVCETGTQDYAVTGIGADDFPGQSSSGCLGAGGAGLSTVEGNSIWFRFRAAASGEMGFNIIPFDPSEDWDFALYGPSPTCGSLGDPMMSNSPGVTVCNYAPGGGSGNTGAGVDPSTGTQTARYSPYFSVVAGEEYLLLINSWAGNNNQFTLEWTGRLVSDTSTNPLDCSIVAGELGADQNVCEGTQVDLDATPSTGTATAYEWQLDEGSGFMTLAGQTNAILSITDNRSGTYKVIVTDDTNNTAEDEVVITFYAQPVAVGLADPTYEICDDDLNGTVSFDLQTLFASEILGTQDPATFEVVFFASQADADANSSPLPNPYVNTNATETIYARVHNIASPTTCNIATTNFTITVNALPAVQNPTNYEFCDNNNDGDDTNGIIQDFVLGSRDTQILGGLNAADYSIAYYLTSNEADTETNAIDKVAPYTNTTRQQEIYVVVTNNMTNCKRKSVMGDPNFGTLTLQVHELPVITTPVTLTLCDTDNDAIIGFDLTTANASISTGAGETFTYFPSLLDAQSNTNTIAIPTNFENRNPNTDTVWARVTNSNGCYRIAEINLVVNANVIPNTLLNTYSACDDYTGVANSDLDGTTVFDFSAIDADIIALFPAGQTLTITHHVTQAEALAGMNAIPDISNYRNTGTVNPEPIYTRVENGVCAPYIGNHILLSVDPVPSADVVANIEVCDDNTDGNDTNGVVQSFDLESQTATILGAQNAADFTVTYHVSAGDANTGANPLSSPYTNATANQQTIHVRVTNNTTGCFTDHTNFDLIVHPLPVIANIVELKQCDDDTDGFSDFNLTEANQLISTNHTNETFTYYPTQADAMADTNPIANPIAFTNRTTPTDRVWARATNSNTCYRIAQVDLVVSTTGIPATFSRTFNTCDDFLDINGADNANNDDTDGVSTFDFSSVEADVRALFPVTQQLTITYYRNSADALAEQNAITNTSSYRNIGYPNSQAIYIRVDSNLDNGCLGFGPYITLNVDPVPVETTVADLELCDDFQDGNGTNGFVQSFDLDSQTTAILNGQSPANFTVSYHLSANEANTGANPQSSPFTNTVRDRQTIYVRITNNTTGCFTDHTTFDVVVNPLPIANFVADLEVCDDNTDGSARNGFAQGIDLEVQTAGILGSQDPNVFTVTYHGTLAEAQAGIVPLVSNNFSNSVPYRQTIYVRVFNANTQCANGISNFDVVVNPEPVFTPVSNLSLCDNDNNGNGSDTDGIREDIDLESVIPGLLAHNTVVQDPDDFNVSFHESQADATSGANPLPTTFYTNTTPDLQPIFVRIENKATGCVNDDATFNIIINPLPDFQVTTPQIVCLNGPTLTISVENPADVYDYVWTDPLGNDTIGSFLTVSSGGLYSVKATTTNGTNCSRTRTIQVNESIIATITQDDVTIVDDSDNNSITIDPTNLGIGDYEYALADENNIIIRSYQDQPLFDRLQGGFYNILVRDKNGCGEVSLLVSVVEFPKFFTPNNDGINDTWAVKGANSTFFPTSSIYIFNRYGKVVATLPIDSQGWNGEYGGNRLPSDDYWFAIRLVDTQGTVRERKGNFSLLRK